MAANLKKLVWLYQQLRLHLVAQLGGQHFVGLGFVTEISIQTWNQYKPDSAIPSIAALLIDMFRAAGFETHADKLHFSKTIAEFHMNLQRITREMEMYALDLVKNAHMLEQQKAIEILQQQVEMLLQKTSISLDLEEPMTGVKNLQTSMEEARGSQHPKSWHEVRCTTGCGERIQAFMQQQEAVERERSRLARLAFQKFVTDTSLLIMLASLSLPK